MAPGKTASQAGHAYLGAYLQALRLNPQLTADYTAEHPDSPGTKVCLEGNLNRLMWARNEAQRLGIPHFLVVDSGCENFYSGAPTITALGLGPALRSQIESITKKFKLL
jgi:peptidyl-tRNA hydrolase